MKFLGSGAVLVLGMKIPVSKMKEIVVAHYQPSWTAQHVGGSHHIDNLVRRPATVPETILIGQRIFPKMLVRVTPPSHVAIIVAVIRHWLVVSTINGKPAALSLNSQPVDGLHATLSASSRAACTATAIWENNNARPGKKTLLSCMVRVWP